MGPSVLSSGQTVNEDSILTRSMFKLSRRMQLIYDLLLPGKPVWDFCCDHGYMGLNAYESGLFPEVYFVDKVEHIIAQLKTRFENEYHRVDSPAQAHFLAQQGEEIARPLRGSVVVAGVGAFTIFKIIQSLHEKGHLEAERLILCPQRDEEKLLQFFAGRANFGYELSNEHYEVVERGRTRKLLIFDKN
ncbi:SAM-dependent methyltransferase [uncultured Bdellovibrio sp.]|uniref:SAM-dependent methyltransferase n=1 Tax=Bdellovibrio sp. HCB-162 TaxID=3394234 RepID=UPI0025D0BD76|nr:SAM-dependent methyltransferase [uncultured Bdellovibrio sp.]